MYSGVANLISNGWKKAIGENKGINETGILLARKQQEKDLKVLADQSTDANNRFQLLTEIKTLTDKQKELETIAVTLRETFPSIELGGFVESVRSLIINENPWPEEVKGKLKKLAEDFYSNYYKPIDKDVFVELLDYYFNFTKKEWIPESLQQYAGIDRETLQNMANQWYDNSVFSSKEKFLKLVEKKKKKEIIAVQNWLKNNTLFLDAKVALTLIYNTHADNKLPGIQRQIAAKYRDWVAQIAADTTGKYFPDANLTLRVAYGQMEGFSPYNGMVYLPYTTTDGILQKENPDIFDYKVDGKLKDLLIYKDFGQYADTNGEMRVAFLASNHTAGGNSGSPILNGNGELVGINFDRAWEGVMSDLFYDINRCRNISMDIRYALFIVDKFAGAGHLIEEMEIR
jgi:hypothetical protein